MIRSGAVLPRLWDPPTLSIFLRTLPPFTTTTIPIPIPLPTSLAHTTPPVQWSAIFWTCSAVFTAQCIFLMNQWFFCTALHCAKNNIVYNRLFSLMHCSSCALHCTSLHCTEVLCKCLKILYYWWNYCAVQSRGISSVQYIAVHCIQLLCMVSANCIYNIIPSNFAVYCMAKKCSVVQWIKGYTSALL